MSEVTEEEFQEASRKLALLDAPRRTAEEREVRELGDRLGYGRVMQLAEQIWDAKCPGGAISRGPCTASLVPCPCPDSGRDANGHCTWCCGAGRVTERVLRAIEERATIERLIANAETLVIETGGRTPYRPKVVHAADLAHVLEGRLR